MQHARSYSQDMFYSAVLRIEYGHYYNTVTLSSGTMNVVKELSPGIEVMSVGFLTKLSPNARH